MLKKQQLADIFKCFLGRAHAIASIGIIYGQLMSQICLPVLWTCTFVFILTNMVCRHGRMPFGWLTERKIDLLRHTYLMPMIMSGWTNACLLSDWLPNWFGRQPDFGRMTDFTFTQWLALTEWVTLANRLTLTEWLALADWLTLAERLIDWL